MTQDYAALLDGFERRDIDVAAFDHRAHVGVAYEMLRKYDFLEASTKYAACIDAIATAAGAAQKFNTTITLAFLSLIAERMQVSSHDDFAGFIEENEDLLASDVLSRWYSKERLASDMARRVFLLPDVA